MISRQTIELKEKAAYAWAMSAVAYSKDNSHEGNVWSHYSGVCEELVTLSERLDKSEEIEENK